MATCSQQMFDLVFAATDAGRLVPVYFSETDLAIGESDVTDAFAFSPTAAAVGFTEPGNLADAGTRRDRFDIENPAHDLDRHPEIVSLINYA
jgi:hypothetical protein